MGFFDSLFNTNTKPIEEMSDSEIIRALKRDDIGHAYRAKLCMEAENRGIPWRQSEWDKRYKNK